MSVLSWLLDDGPEKEDQLMKPMPGETESLETHVEICARRYKSLKDSINLNLTGQRYVFIALVALVLAVLFGEPAVDYLFLG